MSARTINFVCMALIYANHPLFGATILRGSAHGLAFTVKFIRLDYWRQLS
jgi:hypothetical protein